MNNNQTENKLEREQSSAPEYQGIRVRQAGGKHRRGGMSLFLKIYLGAIAVFLVALVIGLAVLHSYLGDYESVQPKYAAEEIFEEYFADPDIAELIEMSSTVYAAFDTQDRVVEYLAAQVEGKKITYAESSAKDEDGARSYNVLCDGARFAVFSIEESDEEVGFGLHKFKLKSVKLTFSLPDNSYNFLIPEGYSLYANGVEVPDKYIAADPVPSDAYTVSGGKYGTRFVPYTVDGFLSAPTFEVKDKNGEPCRYAYDEQTSVYVAETHSATVKVPVGCVPYIGGVALTEEHLVPDSTEASVFNAYIGEAAAPLNYVSYTLAGFVDVPEFTVMTADGVECRVISDGDAFEFEALPAYSTEMQEEHKTWIRDAYRKLTLYLQYDPNTTKASVRVYFDTTSEVWQTINTTPPSFNYEAEKYSFTDDSVSDFVVYDEDHFSCRVVHTFNGVRKGKEYVETTDLVVFFKRSGGKYLIYNSLKTEALSGLGVEG